jgi:hypothetical protein
MLKQNHRRGVRVRDFDAGDREAKAGEPHGIRTRFSNFVKLRDSRSNLQESAR